MLDVRAVGPDLADRPCPGPGDGLTRWFFSPWRELRGVGDRGSEEAVGPILSGELKPRSEE